MSWFSSLCSSIGGALSNAFSTISNVLRDSTLMQKLLPILSVVIPPPMDAVAVIAIMAISAALGVDEKHSPEELGWQMNEAGKNGTKPEDFASFEEYRKYLNENYPVDKETEAGRANLAKVEGLSEDERRGCRYVGLAGMMAGIREAKDFVITPNALGMLAGCAMSLNMDASQKRGFFEGTARALQQNGEKSLQPIVDLAKGEIAPNKYELAMDALAQGAKSGGVEASCEMVRDSLQETKSV